MSPLGSNIWPPVSEGNGSSYRPLLMKDFGQIWFGFSRLKQARYFRRLARTSLLFNSFYSATFLKMSRLERNVQQNNSEVKISMINHSGSDAHVHVVSTSNAS